MDLTHPQKHKYVYNMEGKLTIIWLIRGMWVAKKYIEINSR